ncbi:MAG: hypothetical protein Q8T09_08780 [Candidatus Melainabacteria bacterium]|nr:hypothetical protein [Candidatus Melainabacteria bacterium]
MLYLLSQPAEKYWTALYYSPCGNYREPVILPINALSVLNEKHYAFELLDCIINAKCAQSQWESVSSLYLYLQTIDREGKIDSATWLQLCRPLDSRMKQIFQRSFEERSLSKSRPERYMAVNPRGLIAGYENHQLLGDAEKWFVLLEQREEKLCGRRSYWVTQAKLDHANFCLRHDRSDKAKAIVRSIQDDVGDGWCISFKNAGKASQYYYKRQDGKNFVKFEE